SSSSDFIVLLVGVLVPGTLLEKADPVRGPVGEECLPDDPRLGYGSPEPAVLGVWPIVPHHVEVTTRDGDRAGKIARSRSVARGDVRVLFPHAVAHHVSVDDRDPVAADAHHAL